MRYELKIRNEAGCPEQMGARNAGNSYLMLVKTTRSALQDAPRTVVTKTELSALKARNQKHDDINTQAQCKRHNVTKVLTDNGESGKIARRKTINVRKHMWSK